MHRAIQVNVHVQLMKIFQYCKSGSVLYFDSCEMYGVCGMSSSVDTGVPIVCTTFFERA